MGRQSSRTLWTAKLAGGGGGAGGAALPRRREPTARAEAAVAGLAPGAEKFAGVCLGIDPSLRGTGLAVLAFEGGEARCLIESRTLKLGPKVPMAECLGAIGRAVAELVEARAVRHVALEQTVYVQNFQTAQVLGAARGAAIAAAAMQGVPVFEYAPLRIKQAVTGFGRASKEQVARTVCALLRAEAVLVPDEADAAGAALCHAFTWRGPERGRDSGNEPPCPG